MYKDKTKKMKNNVFIFSIIFLILFSSCSTDVEINAEYKEIPVVFCVLNPSREYQYVKINKVYLGEGDVYQMARESDSLFFNEEIVVTLKKIVNNHIVSSWTFEKTDTIIKDDGLFANDKNIIFCKKINFGEITKNDIYELTVNIGHGKHIVTGKTNMVYNAQMASPNESNTFVSICRYGNIFRYDYYAGWNATVSDVNMIFNYLEVEEEDTVEKHLSFNISNSVLPLDYQNTKLSSSFSQVELFSVVNSSVAPASSEITRYAKVPGSIGFEIVSANDEYYTYMQITKPSSSFIQYRPTYTNLTGGLGLLASANSSKLFLTLTEESLDSLHRGIYTKDLNFAVWTDYYYQQFFMNN